MAFSGAGSGPAPYLFVDAEIDLQSLSQKSKDKILSPTLETKRHMI
jgi:hypothetical protein